MKLKIKTLNIGSLSKTATATGKFQGNEIQLNFTNRNTTWYDYQDKLTAVGAEFEIDDSKIKRSESGNYYVDRITADTAMDIAKMTRAMAIVKSASTVAED